jgi:hypothetical protein
MSRFIEVSMKVVKVRKGKDDVEALQRHTIRVDNIDCIVDCWEETTICLKSQKGEYLKVVESYDQVKQKIAYAENQEFYDSFKESLTKILREKEILGKPINDVFPEEESK